MERLLVTGGYGFIGSNFIREILKPPSSYWVTNVDAISHGANPSNLTDIRQSNRYRFIKANLSDAKALTKISKIFSQADVIVHFAAETHVDRSIAEPNAFLSANVLGTLNLLEAARKNDIPKFVHISTDEVYGSEITGKSFTEEAGFATSSPYAASKASAEAYVEAYQRTYGLKTVVLRCTNNYGPYQFPEKFIPKVVTSALLGRRVPIYGNGKQIREWIHVEDFCAATEMALRYAPAGSVYNVSGGKGVQNVEVARLVLRQLKKSPKLIRFVEDRPGHDSRYSLDSSKIRDELGWKPVCTFSNGLRETVNWYVKNEKWWKPLLSNEVLSPTPWKLKS